MDEEQRVHGSEPAASVVVGIDGSSSAIHAAEWAVDEAISRNVPLRLVYVVRSTATDIARDTEHAAAALRAADAAVSRTGRPVKVETAILRGPVAATLVAAAVEAALVCVGAVGLGAQATKFVGSTGTAVARTAVCPTAIIRAPIDHSPFSPSGDIAVVIDDSMELDVVVPVALQEARLRNTALLVLNVTSSRIRELAPEEVDRNLARLLARRPEVPSRVVMVPDDIPAFLAEHETPVQLIVVDGGDAAARLNGPYGRFVLRDAECSVLRVPS
jgi:nucleotide-binding universal stress UspA family protein